MWLKKTDYSIITTDGAGNAQPAVTGENEKLKGALAISPVILSLNVGIGAEYPINNSLAGYFGVFFNNGFLPDATVPRHYKIENVPDFQDGNIRVNNFAFRLGLFF
ncbi:MAG: hypothetical protein KL787_08520 [Taibaiella sp.]|nr:hypothetical protein [Taibaiella sp.]